MECIVRRDSPGALTGIVATHSPHFRFDPDVDVDAVTLQATCVPLSVPTVPARNHEKFVRVVQSK